MDAQKSNAEALTAQFPPNPAQPTQTTHPAQTGEIFGAMTAKHSKPQWIPFVDPLDEGPLPDDKQLVWVAKKDGSVFIYTFSPLTAPWSMVNAVAWMPAVKPEPPVIESEATTNG